eukprot:4849550-Pleurochrysis_carterae.AAC.1
MLLLSMSPSACVLRITCVRNSHRLLGRQRSTARPLATAKADTMLGSRVIACGPQRWCGPRGSGEAV